MPFKTLAALMIATVAAAGENEADKTASAPDSLGALHEWHRMAGPQPLEAVEPTDESTTKNLEESRTNLFPLYKHRKHAKGEKTKVLPVIVGEAYSHKRYGDRTETEVLDVPFASLVKAESDGADHREVKLVNLPFTTLVEAEEHKDRKSLKLVDIPFFTLVDNEDHGDGEFDNKLIKLPLIGSLFRHKRTDDEEKVRFLFFTHTRHVDKHDTDHERSETRLDKLRRTRQARY